MSKTDKDIILDHLRNLDYLWVKQPIRTWFGLGEVVGWNVHSSSVVRKNYTLRRLEQEIEENQLPIVIVDWPEHSNCFRVYLKEIV